MEEGIAGSKRKRQEIGSEISEKDDHVTKRLAKATDDLYILYIIKNKLTSGRLAHLKSLSIKNGFKIVDNFDNTVTHIVTALPTLERVKDILNISQLHDGIEVVTVEWLTSSFIEGKPVQITDRYKLKSKNEEKVSIKEQTEKDKIIITDYECQRPTLLDHPNTHITDGLEVLEKYYQLLDHKQGDTRALAFRQASCTIKALPKKVVSIEEVQDLHRIGKHSIRVIEDIVSCGFSKEIEDIRTDTWFQCMELFTSVYGCGPATADKWYKKGLRTIGEAKEQMADLNLTESLAIGLTYYEELSIPIPRAQVEAITEIIKKEVMECCPDTSVEPAGGYRRGKRESHDVDLLLSHDKQLHECLLETVMAHLKKKDMIIHASVSVGQNTLSHVQSTHASLAGPTYTSQGQQIKRVQFDHLDKAICVMKLKTGGDTIVRRVDLIVVPPDQYPFALVSWTGSKQFNRSLRRYAVRECSKSVTAHGIFDLIQRKFIPAKSEKDIFDILKLNYLEPWERNC